MGGVAARIVLGVVLFGTGSKAALEGYSSGGKTGSAQIFDVKANRYTHSYNGSYMGFAPLNNPRYVVVVLIELGIIAWVRHRFMDTPLTSAVFQVVFGGLLVFATGVLIGRGAD